MIRVAFFVLFLSLVIIACNKKDHCSELIDSEFNGTVVRKELAKRFKTPYIYYNDEQGSEQWIYLTGYDNRLYEFVKPGDSIYKRRHVRDISIVREGRSFTYPLECGPNLTR